LNYSFRFEYEMVPQIVKSLSDVLNQSSSIAWATEFNKGCRQIDILVAHLNDFYENQEEVLSVTTGLRRLKYAQMEILSMIGDRGRVTPEYLAKKSWLPLDEIKRYIADFINLGLTERVSKRSYAPTLWAKFMPKCIISIEAKLADWSTALKQALDNKPAVDFSYVAFPLANFRERKTVLRKFRRYGIGVLGISKDDKSEILVHPKRNPVNPVDYLVTAIKVSKELSFSNKWSYLQK